jgi:hypothetical protein
MIFVKWMESVLTGVTVRLPAAGWMNGSGVALRTDWLLGTYWDFLLGKGGCCLKHNQSRAFLMPLIVIYRELGTGEALIATRWTVPCYKSVVRGPDLASTVVPLPSVWSAPPSFHTGTQTFHLVPISTDLFYDVSSVSWSGPDFIWHLRAVKLSVREKLEILIGQLLSMSYI